MLKEKLAILGFDRAPFEAEHDAYRESLRRFFQQHAAPNLKLWEKDGFFPQSLFREAGKAGLLCPGIPAEYGGGGGDVRHHVIFHEEGGFTLGGAALETGMSTDITAYCLLNSGTEAQRQQWLPKIAAGEEIMEIAISEPDAGSDVQGIKAQAIRDGEDYILNGQKMWITNGPLLTTLLVVARTPETAGRDIFNMFLVPANAPGVTHVGPTELLIRSAGGVSEFFFDNVRIPKANLLGGVEGKGLAAAFSVLLIGRVCMAARSTATAELALQLTLDHVKERKAFNQRIIDFQNTQFQLAAAAAEIAACRALTDQAITGLYNGTLTDVEAAKAKYFTTEAEWRILDSCFQLFGGAAFSNDHPMSKIWTGGRAHRVFGGTSEIMRTIIARSLMKD
ncbi:acyl-CoA dehydrogenase family protein [Sphingopyxis granuli]|uniref:acyl-CoA dehydrogenase family protein n=1 Tax=Sphingopyxis granuli TaxID=267128 RepID=UPI001F530A22|nr:acyl-CoA dehydrogenase family protein [Sphingopyxis granuli]UNK81055.1 acyl-CoA dehydrogenase family protein [Sphingopyxis granuli]